MKGEGTGGLCISLGLRRKLATYSGISTESIRCRTFAQVLEELEQTGNAGAAQKLAPAGSHFHLEAGGRRGEGDAIPAQGPARVPVEAGTW